MTCSVDGCNGDKKAHGLCGKHYMRLWRTGDPMGVRKCPGPTPEHAKDRFWRHVEKTRDCWPWTGGVGHNGYGNFSRGRKRDGQVRAHRFSWEMHFGPIPVGMFVCHHCDNPACVKPDHLFLGTHADNMRDAVRKDRTSHEPKNLKLTRGDVAEIRERLAMGQSQRRIARAFDVSQSNIGKIHRGETWVR